MSACDWPVGTYTRSAICRTYRRTRVHSVQTTFCNRCPVIHGVVYVRLTCRGCLISVVLLEGLRGVVTREETTLIETFANNGKIELSPRARWCPSSFSFLFSTCVRLEETRPMSATVVSLCLYIHLDRLVFFVQRAGHECGDAEGAGEEPISPTTGGTEAKALRLHVSLFSFRRVQAFQLVFFVKHHTVFVSQVMPRSCILLMHFYGYSPLLRIHILDHTCVG